MPVVGDQFGTAELDRPPHQVLAQILPVAGLPPVSLHRVLQVLAVGGGVGTVRHRLAAGGEIHPLLMRQLGQGGHQKPSSRLARSMKARSIPSASSTSLRSALSSFSSAKTRSHSGSRMARISSGYSLLAMLRP